MEELESNENYTITLTKHAEQRIKERMGIPKKAQKRMIDKIVDQGIQEQEMPKLLRDWVTHVVLVNSPENTYGWIYDNVLFIINNFTVITVLTVPGKLNRYVQIAINNKNCLD